MEMTEIKEKIRTYVSEVAFNNGENIKDDTQIFDEGLLDSMGLLFLVEFINENFELQISDDELNPDNFRSIDNIVSFISSKM